VKRWDDPMGVAIELAKQTQASGDVPVGAIVLDADMRVVGRGRNEREQNNDPTAHAEIRAITEAAAAQGNWNLSGHTLVATLEPCPMCAGAILNSRIERVVFGAWDEKAGAAGSVIDLLRTTTLPQRVNEVIGGVREEECAEMLKEFFGTLRS
jgi:tRNA(adenine34) deaminase